MNQEQFIKKINIVSVEIDKMINNCDEYKYLLVPQELLHYLNQEYLWKIYNQTL